MAALKIRPPQGWVGRSLKDLDLVSQRLSPVAFRRGNDVTVNPSQDIVLSATDELILLGRDEHLERIGR